LSASKTAGSRQPAAGRRPAAKKSAAGSGRSKQAGSRQQAAGSKPAVGQQAGTKLAASTAGPRGSDDTKALVAAARTARLNAHADYSHFKVGAALETADGTIVTGCNIENATYGLTLCAERVAMFKALSDGHRHFRRVAVVADTEAPTPPCGPCRQILWEFGGDLEVILANLRRETGRHALRELLPLPFDRRLLT
jgi:cytidine deaminase